MGANADRLKGNGAEPSHQKQCCHSARANEAQYFLADLLGQLEIRHGLHASSIDVPDIRKGYRSEAADARRHLSGTQEEDGQHSQPLKGPSMVDHQLIHNVSCYNQ